MAKNKFKSKAQIYVPQTRDDAAADVRKIGDVQRSITRLQGEMNDLIGGVTEDFQVRLAPLCEQLELLQEGVQGYCEAHRDELTNGNKVKFANLVTGNVLWRQRPPSVRITGTDAVIDTLKRLGLCKFVRTKDEVNKEAILNEADQVRGVAGITVVTGVEDFVIEPFEQEVQ